MTEQAMVTGEAMVGCNPSSHSLMICPKMSATVAKKC
jgi:hypothetical protein